MKFYEKNEDIVGEIQRNSVVNGDCLEVMKMIKDSSVDMVLCDLPYG